MKKKRSKLHKKIRKFFQKIHLWVGLAICIPIVIIGLTGSILVFQEYFSGLFAPEYKLEAGDPHSVEEIINAAQQAAPGGLKAVTYIAPVTNNDTAKVRFAPDAPKMGFATVAILIDSASLKVVAIDYLNSGLLHQIFMLHSYLLVKEYNGRNIVGWIGVFMLFMTISGIVIWWPKNGKWKKSLTIKRNAKGLRLHRDVHNVIGIWGLLVIVTVSFTGIYLSFPKVIAGAVSGLTGARDMRADAAKIQVTKLENIQKINADKAIAIAKQAIEGSNLISVTLPAKPEQPYRVNLAYSGYIPQTPAITIFIDPWSEKILAVQDPRTYSLAEKFVAWQRTLHEGQGFGWVWQMLVFIAGFSPLLFAITGISMWLIKRNVDYKKQL